MWWYILENNVPQSGINDDQIIAAVNSGRVTAGTLLATDQGPEWRPAAEYPFLAAALAGTAGPAAERPAARPVLKPVSEPERPREFAQTAVYGTDDFSRDVVISGEERMCPHCWKSFGSGNVLYISQHPSLFGDPMVPDEQKRFVPERFDASGQAVDAGGMSCPDMACPHCHLRLAPTVVDLESLFYSIVGAPASGKSYFLTSMLHRLKERLPGVFDVSVTDADPVGNEILTGCETRLFMSGEPDKLTALEKTQLAGEMYNTIHVAGRQINMPRPFIYKLHSQWPNRAGIRDWNVVFYDNAGEHFQPGADDFANPGSRHLVHSDGIIFLFDPTADPRFRSRMPGKDGGGGKVQNQMALLEETLSRLRRYHRISAGGKYEKPFIVAVSKFDAWTDLSPLELAEMEPSAFDPETGIGGCNAYLMENVSFYTREVLLAYVPEFVHAVEAGASDVTYLPNSALGCSAVFDEESGGWGVRPRDISPVWAEAPLLWMLMRGGFLAEFRRGADQKTLPVEKFSFNDDYVIFMAPRGGKRYRLPRNWAGRLLTDPINNYRFIVPGEAGPASGDDENGEDDGGAEGGKDSGAAELWEQLGS